MIVFSNLLCRIPDSISFRKIPYEPTGRETRRGARESMASITSILIQSNEIHFQFGGEVVTILHTCNEMQNGGVRLYFRMAIS